MTTLLRRTGTALLTLAALASAAPASAGGLYFSDRGVRPLGRGGAFVAGADDGGAIAYNPAGLAFAPKQFLFDASWLQYTATYQRHSLTRQTDPNTGQPTGAEFEYTHPRVKGTTPVLPIPTLAYVDDFGMGDKVRFALGAWAPYAAVTSFPANLNGQPAPQRYSLISLDGSALAIVGAYGAYRPTKDLALGAGVEALGGYFQTSVAFSACVPDRFICAAEDPSYDAYSQLRVGPIVAPSGIVGATWVPSDLVRVGASFHLPFWISAPATVQVRLPSAAAFDGARQEGDSAHVDFRLPWTLRTGVEVRPGDTTRVEASFVYEAWSMHDEIRLDPDNVALANVTAFPQRYYVGPISLPRGFQDTWSVRLGGEQSLEISGYQLDLRAGVAYEKSAVPPAYLSANSIDLDKVTLAFGGSLHVGKWRLDGVVARVIGSAQDVDPHEGKIPQTNPVIANPAANPSIVNGGHYEANATVLGVGLAYRFGDAPK